MVQSDAHPSHENDHKSASQKKPRHRHSPAQLAALNELFEQDEHPPLEIRSALAERLGMETKTVNAWFQNKRASTKKRFKNSANRDNSNVNSSSSGYLPPLHPKQDYDDYHDEDYPPAGLSRASSVVPPDGSSYYYGNSMDSAYFASESESIRRMRMRPSQEQTEELKRLYNINPHPTAEQRQVLSERIGMRYQSITNWFQNQRSLAKKRKDDETDYSVPSRASSEYQHDLRRYSAFPPPTQHPSLSQSSLPAQTSHAHQNPRHSPTSSLVEDFPPSRRTHSRRSTTPYSSMSVSFSRPRRSRPEPYQLDALKRLFRKTPTPSIEERSALALEIGMDVSKVTNWFRNLRQTARKRAKKGNVEEDDYNPSSYSTNVSRSGTPSLPSSSSSSSSNSHAMDEDYEMRNIASDAGSEEDYQEVLTPSPRHSPSPPPPVSPVYRTTISAVNNISVTGANNADLAYYAELEKMSATRYSGIKIEDALLLLSFHQRAVH